MNTLLQSLTPVSGAKNPTGKTVGRAADVVILGTSPILLIEGLFHAKAGEKVIFIDDAPNPGGIWAPANALGINDVEGACHLMANYIGIYDFLTSSCGIEMEVVSPQPLIQHKGAIVPFNTVGQALNRWKIDPSKSYSLASAWRVLSKRRLCPLIGPSSRKAIRYPKGGSPRMIKHLVDTLSSYSTEFVQSKAEGLSITENGLVSLRLEDGTEIRTPKLVAPEAVSIDYVETNNRRSEFNSTLNPHEVLVARVSGIDPGSLGYIELPGNPHIERLADVTEYCSNPPTDSRVILFENPDIGPTRELDSDQLTTIVTNLKTEGILPQDAEIEEHTLLHKDLPMGNRDLLKVLRSLQTDSIEILPSEGDLSYSIHLNRKRWDALAPLAQA